MDAAVLFPRDVRQRFDLFVVGSRARPDEAARWRRQLFWWGFLYLERRFVRRSGGPMTIGLALSRDKVLRMSLPAYRTAPGPRAREEFSLDEVEVQPSSNGEGPTVVIGGVKTWVREDRAQKVREFLAKALPETP